MYTVCAVRSLPSCANKRNSRADVTLQGVAIERSCTARRAGRTQAVAPDTVPALPIVLASGSPRRRALLARTGLPFLVAAPTIDESPQAGESGEALARRLARAKALVGAARYPGAIVVAADTVVLLDGQLLGKSADIAEARTMLEALRGRPHTVTTAVCVVRGADATLRLAALTTRVWMRQYSDAEIASYIASGDPFDKAGAYAIQHPRFRPVARWQGCYTNVVGLPLCLTAALLHSLGVRLPRTRLVAADHA